MKIHELFQLGSKDSCSHGLSSNEKLSRTRTADSVVPAQADSKLHYAPPQEDKSVVMNMIHFTSAIIHSQQCDDEWPCLI